MRKKIRSLVAAGCMAALVMTVSGMAVLAEDMQEEIVIFATQEEDAPDEGQVIPETGQELTGDTDAYESIDSYESGLESTEEDEEHDGLSQGESLDEEMIPDQEEEEKQNNEEVVGTEAVVVGDGVTATFDKDTGAVGFISQNGELWRNWVDKLVSRDAIKSIEVISGTVNLPADSSGVDRSGKWYYMFGGLTKLESLDLNGINTSNVTNMSSMFYNCNSLTTLDLSNLNTSSVTQMNGMFGSCRSLTNLELTGFDTSNVTDMTSMFYGCKSLTNLDLSSFDTSKVTSMNSMFYGCKSLTNLDLRSFDTSNVESLRHMFAYCNSFINLNLNGFVTSNVTSMEGMFSDCEGLTSLNLSSFDTSNVTIMHGMFSNCSSLTSLNLRNFNTLNVTSMEGMFSNCESLTSLNLSSFDTSNVTDMSSMFYGCKSLTNLDLSSFDTSNVTDMNEMFYGCKSLTNLDLSSFDTSKVWDNWCYYVLYGCVNLQLVRTPQNNTQEISFPVLLYDGAGNGYGSLPKSVGSIVLAKTQQMAQEYEKGNTQPIQVQAHITHYNAAPIYGGTGTGLSNEEVLRTAYSELAKAIDNYMTEWNKAVRSEANTETAVQQLRQADEAMKQPVLTKKETATGSEINAAYKGLAEFYDRFRKDHPALEIGRINLSDDMVTIESKIIREIQKSIKTYYFTTSSGGYHVTVNIIAAGIDSENNAFTGSITAGTAVFPICSGVDANVKTMARYMKILNDTAEGVTKQGLKAYLSEFADMSCITSFEESAFKDLFSKIYDYMYKKGYGKISRYIVALYRGYNISKEVSALNSPKLAEKLQSAESLYKQIKDMSFTDNAVKDESIKIALKKVEAARADLEQKLYNYIYHPDEELSTERGFLDHLGNFFKRITGKCPVDFTIYDESGNVLGRTEGSYCEFTDSIYIEMSGEVESIYIPNDLPVRIVANGTGGGSMSYSVEQFEEGNAVSRINYYDVPLSEGKTYEQIIPSGTISGDLNQLPLTDEEENTIYGTESLGDGVPSIAAVDCWTSDGGSVYGAGEYVRGDCAEMIAYADKGYSFDGWYVEDVLVESNEVYRFAVTKDVTVNAIFSPMPQAQTITCEDAIEKTYGDGAFALEAYTSGDSGLCYYPENEEVAVVSDDGIVTINAAGSTTILITANGTDKYASSYKEVSLTVSKADPEMSFTDAEVTKTFKDTEFINELTKRTDSTVTFSSSDTGVAVVDCVSGRVTIKGLGKTRITASATEGKNYRAGDASYILTVSGASIEKASVAGVSLSYGYSGKAYTPALTVKLNGATLTEGKDYTVKYGNNIKPGTATITITGKGNYTGTRTKTFEIVDCVSSIVSGKTYQLIPKNNSKTAVSSFGGRMVNNTKVYITDRSSSEAMKFKAIKKSDGTWKFINAKCELALAVQQNSSEVGKGLVLYDQTTRKAQNWKLSRKSDNSFAIMNAVTGYSIAMSDASAVKGTTLSMAETASSGLQRFYLAETSPVKAPFDGTKSVRAAKDKTFGLNIASASKTDGANVNLYKYSNANEKKFKIMYSGGGYYRLVNVNSGLVVSVKGNTKTNGANVIQSKWAGESGQRWKFTKNSDGSVTLTNALGTALHLNGNKTANGTNVIAKTAAATTAQRWYLQ